MWPKNYRRIWDQEKKIKFCPRQFCFQALTQLHSQNFSFLNCFCCIKVPVLKTAANMWIHKGWFLQLFASLCQRINLHLQSTYLNAKSIFPLAAIVCKLPSASVRSLVNVFNKVMFLGPSPKCKRFSVSYWLIKRIYCFHCPIQFSYSCQP